MRAFRVDEPIRFVESRQLQDKVSSITISKDAAGRYFVALHGEQEKKPLPISDKAIGIDLGLTSFVSTSDGEKIKAPNIYRKHEKRLVQLQRRMSRKQKGSKNRLIMQVLWETYYE